MYQWSRSDILEENDHFMLVYKPAGLAVESRGVGTPDLEHILMKYLSEEKAGGSPYLSAINRLDQVVEGIVLFARDKKSAQNLSAQLRSGAMEKTYLAVTEGVPAEKTGMLTDYLVKVRGDNRTEVVPEGTPGAKKAVLTYDFLGQDQRNRALLRIHLVTGRHHQIRVQLSHAGIPILGDRKYGKNDSLSDADAKETKVYPALCAYELGFTDPVTKKRIDKKIRPRGTGFLNFVGLFFPCGYNDSEGGV